MPCYHPLKAWKGQKVSPETGKRNVVFNRNEAFTDLPMELPCGQCIGCRLERSRQWAIRCVHEAQMHEDNMFITLTYDDEHLPEHASLKKKDFVNFMKRYRKSIAPKKIRFFHGGEYGENDYINNNKHLDQYGISKLGRPHHHAIIFGHRFDDLELVDVSDVGHKLWSSERLRAIWQHGDVTLGDVSFESAAYVARYCMKKMTGESAEKHYKRLFIRGEVSIEPEYATMSRRPGIGAGWLEKFRGDCYPKDFVTVRGKIVKPPKFYDKIIETQFTELFEEVKYNRIKSANRHKEDNTYERLMVRKKCKEAKLKSLKRKLDEE